MKIKGLTLIEILVVAFIGSIIGISVVFVVANSNNILSDNVAVAFKNRNTQRIMDLISTDIRKGARLSSTDSQTLIIMDANDNNLYEWSGSEGVITRTVYDDIGNSTTKDILIFSTASREIKPIIIYTTSITGQFFNVKVDIYLKEILSLKEVNNITKLSNVFYCRLDPML
ncbi:MAG: hypothetical protein PF638_14520 [Candidatus Delongbacteria bacterium]|jgi:hypothetical protein|nr:hypothetical protein [Candidatus Delongbacteria bacterium]